MYDYDCKEEVSPQQPSTSITTTVTNTPNGKSSITPTTIEFIYSQQLSPPISSSPSPTKTEILLNAAHHHHHHHHHANVVVHHSRHQTTTTTTRDTTVTEDRKSNDNDHDRSDNDDIDQRPAVTTVASSYRSSPPQSAAVTVEDDGIATPIISNHRRGVVPSETPPALSLPPPTLSSSSHHDDDEDGKDSCTNGAHHHHHHNHNHHAAVSPRFSSIDDTPLVLRRPRDGPPMWHSDQTCASILQQRLPVILDLVTFSNDTNHRHHNQNHHSNDTGTSSSSPSSTTTFTTDILRYSMESFVRLGYVWTMNRIKRTLVDHYFARVRYVTPNVSDQPQDRALLAVGSTTITTSSLPLSNQPFRPLHAPATTTRNTVTSKSYHHHSPYYSVESHTTTKHRRRATGIRNYGQTCFLNAVLQALAALDPFLRYLERIVQLNVQRRQYLLRTTTDDDDDDNDREETIIDSFLGRTFQSTRKSRPEDRIKKSRFCEEMWNVLQAVNGETPTAAVTSHYRSSSIDPRPILLAVGQKHGQFQRRYGGVGVVAVGEQQDAQELMQAVLGMIIDEGQFELRPPAVPSTIMSSFLERTLNNDEVEGVNALVTNDNDESSSLYNNIAMRSASKAMEIMMTTTSSTSPCPLSVWCGSALMCSTCRRVRPIQNVPFLDIPVVPTSISHQMLMYPPRKGQDAPSCRLEECLSEFTAVERVLDVECKNCTIQAEIKERECDLDFQRQIIDGIRSRQTRTSVKSNDIGNGGTQNEIKHVVEDLHAIEAQLDYLRRLSPDDDRMLYKGATATTTIVALEETPSTPTKIPFQRSDAFKCLLLTRLPAIFSIHVQRRYFDPNTGKSSKTMQHINFPEMLDVSSYCAYGAPKHSAFAGTTAATTAGTNRTPFLNGTAVPIWYKLMAVIEHRGGPHAGHYVCYRRDPSCENDRWLWISDDTIRVCPWSTVRNCQAYMLFYEAT